MSDTPDSKAIWAVIERAIKEDSKQDWKLALSGIQQLERERDDLRAEVERLKSDKARLKLMMEEIFVNHHDPVFVKAHPAYAINPQ